MALNLLYNQVIDYSVDQSLNLNVGGNILITRDANTPTGDPVVVNLSKLADVQALSTIVVENGATAIMSGGLASIKALSGVTLNGGILQLSTSIANINALNSITVGPDGGMIKVNATGISAGVLSFPVSFIDSNGKSTTTVPKNFAVDFPQTKTIYGYYDLITHQTTIGLDLNILGLINVGLGPSIVISGNPFGLGLGVKEWTSTSNPDGTGGILICFLKNSMIRTENGDVPVQDLRIGDTIIAYENGKEISRSVTWAGKATATVNPALPDDEAGYPVRIFKDAIADGVPFKDMLITPEHCLFFDGKFIPARMLVNSRTIIYDRTITTYDYYHVETEQHSIIMADGMMTESYLDTGNRASFQQEGTVVRVSPPSISVRTWAEDAAAPLSVAREDVEPLYCALNARADNTCSDATKPLVTDDADIHLVTANGTIIRKARQHKNKLFFMLLRGVDRVWLASRAGRLFDSIGPFIDDRRTLGVLVGDITLQQGSGPVQKIHPATHEATGLSGWHNVEAGATMRWTTGHAEIPLGDRLAGKMALLCVEVLAGGPDLVEPMTKQDMAVSA